MPALAYPTDSKEREKQKKEKLKAEGQVIEVQKKNYHIEDHYDDCGEDMTSIDMSVAMLVDLEKAHEYDTDSDVDHEEKVIE